MNFDHSLLGNQPISRSLPEGPSEKERNTPHGPNTQLRPLEGGRAGSTTETESIVYGPGT